MKCKTCNQVKHVGTCTCCWYPNACPTCGMCDKCGYIPLNIDQVRSMGTCMLRAAYELAPEWRQVLEENR